MKFIRCVASFPFDDQFFIIFCFIPLWHSMDINYLLSKSEIYRKFAIFILFKFQIICSVFDVEIRNDSRCLFWPYSTTENLNRHENEKKIIIFWRFNCGLNELWIEKCLIRKPMKRPEEKWSGRERSIDNQSI